MFRDRLSSFTLYSNFIIRPPHYYAQCSTNQMMVTFYCTEKNRKRFVLTCYTWVQMGLQTLNMATKTYLRPVCIFFLALCIAPLGSSFSLIGRVAREDWAVWTVRDVRADFRETTVIFDRRSSSTKNGLSPWGGAAPFSPAPFCAPLGVVPPFPPRSLLPLLVLLTLLISEFQPECPPGRSIFGRRRSARGVFCADDVTLSVGNHIVVCYKCTSPLLPNLHQLSQQRFKHSLDAVSKIINITSFRF